MQQLYAYSPSTEMDYTLLAWLERMRQDGELSKTISVHNHSPAAFLRLFDLPRRLYFRVDEVTNALTYALWVEPCMGSAFFSFYIAPQERGKKENVWFLFDMLDRIFDYVDTVAAFIQERETEKETNKFLGLLQRVGFTKCGMIPYFFDGKHCHFVVAHKIIWKMGGPLHTKWAQTRARQLQEA